jgi:hypothetical protein
VHNIAFKGRGLSRLQVAALAIVAAIATNASANDHPPQAGGKDQEHNSPPNTGPQPPLGPPPCGVADYPHPGQHLGLSEHGSDDDWRNGQEHCKDKPVSP